jgi:hypothetical protein
MDMPGITCSVTTGAGPAASGAAVVVGPPQPAAITAPAVAAIATAGTTSLVLNWRMVIDPSPLVDSADAGLTNR